MKKQPDPAAALAAAHYDSLIDENNDPARDPPIAREYMDKWDGRAFLDALCLSPEKSVLEIGVGTGRLALRVCGRCARFTGIDLSSKTVERTRKNLREFQNIRLICDDFLTHAFDESFDIIYSSLTFMHIKDKSAAIQKVSGQLLPGGRFVLSISKDQKTELDFITRRIPLFPDTPERIGALLTCAGLTAESWIETEFAQIVAAVKNGAEK